MYTRYTVTSPATDIPDIYKWNDQPKNDIFFKYENYNNILTIDPQVEGHDISPPALVRLEGQVSKGQDIIVDTVVEGQVLEGQYTLVDTLVEGQVREKNAEIVKLTANEMPEVEVKSSKCCRCTIL